MEDRILRILGNRNHNRLVLWFNRHPEAIVNLTALERIMGVSHPTIKKIVRDLKEVGFLKDGVSSEVIG